MGKHIAENRREYDRAYRVAHREDRAAAAKAWRESNAQLASAYFATYRDDHREERREAARAYGRTDEGRAAKAASRVPAHHAAREAVRRAIRSGRLQPQSCWCGSVEAEAHHHRGYEGDARLDVVWLCKLHHEDAHHA